MPDGDCPSTAHLERLAADPGDAQLIEIKQHVDGCSRCAARLEGVMDDNRLLDEVANAAAPHHTAPRPEDDPQPRNIGRYRVIERIGRGGFGVVYLAEQVDPVRRRVALKVMRQGLGSRDLVRRFEIERQALALMDHPNVSAIHDAGRTDDGRPYFVMELVSGSPITSYCVERELSLAERLTLFVEVCDAVHHAHQKGVIHRDLKPSNVLVVERDGAAVPKVIDFGIAKAVETPLTEDTMVTERGQIMGTPEYMSPEQVDPRAGGVDTRTDVYSLGVLLFEMLTGSHPFEHENLRELGFLELVKVIRETRPPLPSAAILQSTTDTRASRPHARSIRGDLDWIVMRCLEKEPDARYASAAAIAEDVRRFLHDEPVTAGPPSRVYKITKFVKRHRGASVATGIAALAIVGGLVGTSFGLLRAHERQTELLTAQGDLEQRAEELDRVSEFQQRMLRDITASAFGHQVLDKIESEITASAERDGLSDEQRTSLLDGYRAAVSRVSAPDVAIDVIDDQILVPAAASAHESFEDQPLVLARLLGAIANLYNDLGRNAQAIDHQREVIALFDQHLGADDPRTITARRGLGTRLVMQGDYEEAGEVLHEVLASRRRVYGEEHERVAGAHMQLGHLWHGSTEYRKAEDAYRTALAILDRLGKADSPRAVWSRTGLANTLVDMGRHEDAEVIHREIMERSIETLGENNAKTHRDMNNLGYTLLKVRKYDEAATLLQRALDLREADSGRYHPDTITTLNNLAQAMAFQGDHDTAERMLEEVLERREHVLGPDHPRTIGAMHNLASMYQSRGKRARDAGDADVAREHMRRAVELFETVVERHREALPTGHGQRITTMLSLALAARDLDEPDLEHRYSREAYELAAKQRAGTRFHASSSIVYAECLHRRGAHEQALPVLEEALRLNTELHGPEESATIRITGLIARTMLELGRQDDALEIATRYHTLVAEHGTAPSIAEACELLVMIHDALHAKHTDRGHAQQAEQWRARASDLPDTP